MSASYDEESDADLDWVRAQLGDVSDPTSDDEFEDYALHTDERIEYVLAQWPSQRGMALAQLAHELVASLGQQPDTVKLASGLSVSFKTLLDRWKALSQPYLDFLAKQAAKPTSSTPATPFSMFGLAKGRRG